MTEPLRDSSRTPSHPSHDTDRAARIEALLVSGLDHYFAAEYEQAINVWTRVVFLERDHDRARAYIERARTAIAERQRESEELLHRGVEAYRSGDSARARDLLTRAVDQGAPTDEALLLLGRLDRFDGAGFDVPTGSGGVLARVSPSTTESADGWGWRWTLVAAVGVVAACAVVLGGAPALTWMVDVPAAAPPVSTAPEPVPVVRPADSMLDAAKGLYVGGHLHDALRLLDRVDAADPSRPDADGVRAAIQRDLLATAETGPPASPPSGPGR